MAVLIDPSAITIDAQATSSNDAIGENQIWQVFTGIRTAGITYTNTTNKAIMVTIQVITGSTLTVNGVVAASSGINDANNYLAAVVPSGATYSAAGSISRWAELRDDPNPRIPATPVSLSNVSLLLRGNGTNGGTTFTDGSLNALPINLGGNAQTSTVQSKYGGSSMLFDGTGDYLSVPYSSAIDLIGSAFTIEAWIYPTIAKATGHRIFATGGDEVGWSAVTGIHVLFQIQDQTGSLSLQLSNNTATPINTLTTGTVSLNTWTHVAAVYDGINSVKIFINGEPESFTIATPSRPSVNPTAGIATIPGELGGNSSAFQGYIDDLMLSKGVARYTSRFTPPGAF